MAKNYSINNDIVFFDGNCGLCHFWVKFTLARDKNKVFNFSPLQGETIKDLISEEKRKTLPDSIVVLKKDPNNSDNILVRSAAISYILKKLGGLWAIVGLILGLLPTVLSDSAYNFIARIRLKLFKKPEDICPITPPDVRDRILL